MNYIDSHAHFDLCVEEGMKAASEGGSRGEYSNMRAGGGLDNVMVPLGPGG
jgi:hypothetical protein